MPPPDLKPTDGKRPAPLNENQLVIPPELDKAFDKSIVDAVKDILPKAQQQQVLERLKSKVQSFAVTVSKIHSGPLPSVETVQGYEDIERGSFGRLLKMAEKDQDAFIDSHIFKNKSDARYRLASLAAGFLSLLVILAIVFLLAEREHEGAALAVAGIGGAGIIGIFVNAWKGK